MSIQIDTNLIYLQNRLHLSADKFELYKNKSVEEIIKAEVAAGNPLAIQLANEILTNVNFFIELFKLADSGSKYTILINMRAQDLKGFLRLLDKNDLVQGLMYFSQNKLLNMLKDVPPQQLVKTVLEMFPPERIIQLMPENQLDKLLTNNNMDKNRLLEHLKSIPPQYLAQVIETVTGQECKAQNSQAMVDQINQFNPLQFNDALTGLQPIQKQQLVIGLVKENQQLLQLFDADAYTKILEQEKQKPEIVKAMAVIEADEIIKMIQQLPHDLLATVLTQIDTEVFADQMVNKHPEIIAKLLAR